MKKTIILNTETTGLDHNLDEILQLAIIDEEENILFNEFFKPTQKMCSNHITSQMVADKKEFSYYKEEIQKIIDDAEILMGYNFNFERKMLERSGIVFDESKGIIDVIKIFPKCYGKGHEYRWEKLERTSQGLGYKWNEHEIHNALGNVKATLFCYRKLKALEIVEKARLENLSLLDYLIENYYNPKDYIISFDYIKSALEIKKNATKNSDDSYLEYLDATIEFHKEELREMTKEWKGFHKKNMVDEINKIREWLKGRGDEYEFHVF